MKFLSRKFIVLIATICLGTFLAYFGKLTNEFVILMSVVYAGFSIADVIEKHLSAMNEDQIEELIHSILDRDK